jgi:hypothetical protein
MTPKEKALEICDKYFTITQESSFVNDIDAAKQCAIIAVDEIINAEPLNPHHGGYYELVADRVLDVKAYWEQVKTEIKNL